MSENRSLFIEKKLNRWKRTASPKPGRAFVFVRDAKPSRVVYEGERSPTQGEVFFGGYKTYYEVDLGDRSISFEETLPCSDGWEFQAEVKLTYVVSDPALIVSRRRTDSDQSLQDLAIQLMRRTSRNYKHTETGEAEEIITRRIEEEVRDNGFKLNRSFIKLSLDGEIRTIIKNKKRAEIYAPLIKAGDWQTLIAMIDPKNDDDKQYIKEMVRITFTEQKMKSEEQQKMFKTLIDLGVIENYELEEMAKRLTNQVGRLSEQSVDLLEGKLEDYQQIEELDIPIPDEISREKDE